MENTKSYQEAKNLLFDITSGVSGILTDLKSLPDTREALFEKWGDACERIYCQVSEEVVRVAVVGTIKSGKSTFVNALFMGDFVKRGAGVITSIVTKIRSGRFKKAKLYFKSWDDVNRDMKQAMTLFPHFEESNRPKHFDIRRKKDRTDVRNVLDSLGADTLFHKDVRETNSVLLSCYLKGYDRIRDLLSADPVVKVYHGAHFDQHRDFVGDQALAVYLQDVHLEIESSRIEEGLEIADCQGSDSPNPLHLTMIQDYLSTTHLIVYIVSSRTGLRDADIRFLSIIRRMGILDNTLFVVNGDLNEHDSLDDFNRVLDTVKEELSLLTPQPRLYGFSALYNLFEAEVDRLPEKDRSRLAQWRLDGPLLSFSNEETTRFETAFFKSVSTQRHRTLLSNHIERLQVIVSGIHQWLGMHREVLRRDTLSAKTLLSSVKAHLKRTDQHQSTLKSALDGAIQKLKQELRNDIDRFFDPHSGPIVPNIVKFVNDFQIVYREREQQLNVSGFANSMYTLFLNLKQALDTHIAESVNPEIIRFFKDLEHRIKECLKSVAASYHGMAQSTFIEYQTVLESHGFTNPSETPDRIPVIELEQLKEIHGITPPSVRVTLQYSARIKTEAVLHYGVYSLTSLIEKAMKRTLVKDRRRGERALKKGVLSLKREMIQSIVSHFKDYHENLKFQYVFKLIEAAAKDLYSNLTDSFENKTSSLKSLSRQITRSGSDREAFLDKINEHEGSIKELSRKIVELTETIAATDS